MIGRVLLIVGFLTTMAACADGRGGRTAAAAPSAAPSASASTSPSAAASGRGSADPHPYVGMWVTADGRIRQELRADGRYEEERDGRPRAYTGRYTVTGNHLDYFDDAGFTATGDVRDGVLYHEHLVLYRER
ncbi:MULTISPECIES: Atu4866 domain-containing protein [unclassified Nonomuraea]|uniref:Atu4866 domain-containing protein n=1 Tax=unclassified Nonomuraea TaxID=2593643 RepID=UPI0035C1EA18